MPSLKDLRNRITSVKSTRKITSAMKMVAAAKLRRAQELTVQARPYAQAMALMTGMLADSMARHSSVPRLLAPPTKVDTLMLVVASADRGLCGGFNTSIARAARQQIDAALADKKQVKIFAIGRKTPDQLGRDYRSHIVEHVPLDNQVSFPFAMDLAGRLIKRFDEGEFDIATVIYAYFRSAMAQQVMVRPLIPFPVPKDDTAGQNSDSRQATKTSDDTAAPVYTFEPEEETIFAQLLTRNLAVQIYRTLLENAASEHGSRMTAMDNATRNAGDMIDDLTLLYNRTRQAVITRELIEIISGAEAL